MEKTELEIKAQKLLDADTLLKRQEIAQDIKINIFFRRFVLDCMVKYSEQNICDIKEISDSDIDKEITERFTSVMPNGYKVIFKEACQWYREKIKLK